MSTPVFEAFAKLTLDSKDYDKGLKDAGGKMNNFGSTIAKGLGGVAAGIGAAIGAAATGIVALTKSAVSGFSEYQQLKGGVETLFKDSASIVMEYADNAYKTAGLSANRYMETVTSFSASLLQSLGGDTVKAAQYADMAIIDMADNANKMGTSMDSIQNAYQGFAKQNYTMLDNLELGYGGTKTEMERLLLDADALSESFNLQKDASGNLVYGYADIVEAIHIVQENMGIAGTTALEASETISGSVGSVKAAWDNLVVGLANNEADLDQLINNVIVSGETALNNLLPIIEKAISGIADAVERIAPIIAEKLPPLVTEILPPLLNAATTLVTALVDALPGLLQVVIDIAPQIIDSIVTTVLNLLPEIIALGVELIVTLAEGIAKALPNLVPTIVDVIIKIVDILTNPSNLERVITAALQIILALAEGLIKALPQLIQAIPQIIQNLVRALTAESPAIVSAALELMVALARGLVEGITTIVQEIPNIIRAIKEGFLQGAQDFVSVGSDFVSGIWEGISSGWQWLTSNVSSLCNDLVGWVRNIFDEHSPSRVFADIGENLALGLGEGYEAAMNAVGRDIQQISEDAIPTIEAPAIDGFSANGRFGGNAYGRGYGYGYGYGSGDIIINIDGSNLTVDEIAEQLGTAVRRQVRLTGAYT